MKKTLFICLALVSIAFYACKKNDSTTPAQNKTVTIDASSHTAWKYFSLSTGDTVHVTDPANSTAWDIAFQRYYMRTNGGRSGKGLAAVFQTTLKGDSGFSALKVVPDNAAFAADDSVSLEMYNPQDPTHPIIAKMVLSPGLTEWYYLIFGASTTLVSNKYVYVIKTADGKYAKLMILSYYKDDSTPAFISFKYVYQPDGSMNLE